MEGNIMWIIGFIVFVLGIIFVIVAPINKRKNTRCSAQTQGTMKKIFDTDSSDGTVGHAYVYPYSVDGVEYNIRSTIHSKEADKVVSGRYNVIIEKYQQQEISEVLK